MKNSLRCPQLLKSILLQDLSDTVAADFLDRCSFHSFDESAMVLHQGDRVAGMYIVAHGSLEITYVSSEGIEVVIHLAGVGESVGEVEAIADMPCAASCTVFPGTALLFAPRALLMTMLAQVTFSRNLAAIFYQRMVRDNRFKTVDQFYPVEQRLCAYLHKMSKDNPLIRKSQSYLARVVGCSRQTINRQLGILRDSAILKLDKSAILILDRPALTRRMGSPQEGER